MIARSMMQLIIFGVFPPPRGGVSTHIERLTPFLEEAGISYTIWDHSKVGKYKSNIVSLRRNPIKALKSLLISGTKVLYYPLTNISFIKLMFLLCLKMIGVRIVVALVASPEQTLGSNTLKLRYMMVIARISFHLIATNRTFKTLLLRHKIPGNKVSVFSAFIPDKNGSSKTIPIPQDALDFCVKKQPLILTYVYGPDRHDGEDLYGLDLLVLLGDELRKDFLEIGIVVVIPEISNEVYFEKIKNSIHERGLDSLFCFAIGNHFSFISFLQYTDLFIRATNTDGDALTLREAVYYGVPSVASDVCHRPEETVLFHNRDFQDLVRVVTNMLSTKNKKRQGVANTRHESYASNFISIFEQAVDAEN